MQVVHQELHPLEAVRVQGTSPPEAEMMWICYSLLVIGLFLGAGLALLEWKMPGFIMNSIRNGMANGRAYRIKREELKAQGGHKAESLAEFSKGLSRTIAFQPPPESETDTDDLETGPDH